MKNIHMEIGSTFAVMVTASPVLAAHVLGMIIDAFGGSGPRPAVVMLARI